jgi:hypothetical protein
VNFLYFWHSKIRVNPTSIVYSLFSLRCCLSSSQRRHAVIPCHASFPLSQDELTASASSSDNVLSHRLPSQAKIKVLNPQHCRSLSSPDYPTRTINCYKKIISTFDTLPLLNYVFILSSPSQSATQSEFQPLSLFPFTAVSRSSSLDTMTPTVMN